MIVFPFLFVPGYLLTDQAQIKIQPNQDIDFIV